jgi:hypothetical protein
MIRPFTQHIHVDGIQDHDKAMGQGQTKITIETNELLSSWIYRL